MSEENPIVFLVDDDPSILKTLSRALEEHGLRVKPFKSARKFLEGYDGQHGCLILDLSLPEMDGLELQAELKVRCIDIPIIFITGHGGVSESVQAIRSGAIDFLEKPFLPETLLLRINEALEIDQRDRVRKKKQNAIKDRFRKMTDREREVFQLLIEGQAVASSKVIAKSLGISHRTVEHHRGRILEKTLCASVPELRALAKDVGFLAREESGFS